MLPRLAFSNSAALKDWDLSCTRDIIEKAVPGLNVLEPVSSPKRFRCLAAPGIELNDLHLAAASHDAIIFERSDSPEGTVAFSIPVFGSEEFAVGRKSFTTVAGLSGALLSNYARKTRTSTISNVLISFDANRLQQTISAMCGERDQVNSVDLSDRSLLLNENGLDCRSYFESVFSIMDSLRSEDMMVRCGLDDQIYRILSCLLARDRFQKSEGVAQSKDSSPAIEIVCAYIRANLDQTIALTELERMSGLSSRSLQYAFQRRFSMTPSQWIREQRLLWAREMLLSQNWSNSVTSIAMIAGFTNHSLFARYYKERFGEIPSETKKKRSC